MEEPPVKTPTQAYAVLVLLAVQWVSVDLAMARRITQSFDADWRFFKGGAPGAERVDFDDGAWRRLDVPHDWSIEGPFGRDHPTGRGGAYLPSGVAWYRKHFALPGSATGRPVYVEFDGVMSHSDVWINGRHLGRRPFGYVSFQYALTPYLKIGGDEANVLVVRTDTSAQPASRWYTGAGIYRHVRLVIQDPVHIDHWGVFAATTEVTGDTATVKVDTAVVNESSEDRSVTLRTRLIEEESQSVYEVRSMHVLAAGQRHLIRQVIPVTHPRLWDLDQPRLYALDSRLLAGGVLLDNERTPFGIRTCAFQAETGFWLNGRNLKIKGVCLHQDGGALGAAVPQGVWERRLRQLKRIGVNAIRTAHNPVSPEFLGLCDRLGLLVMSEVLDTWTVGKNHADQGYQRIFREWWEQDTRDTVLRDRNHPSIILYSAGNEIRDDLNSPQGFDQFKAMRGLFHQLDPTRPVTMGVFRPNQMRVYDSGFSELMDVVGQNYRERELIAAHRAMPTRKVLGTENGHDRRVWLALRDNAFFSGQFLWTGIDYLGEADWPNIAWANAPVDRTGHLRPLGYQRQSWWSEEPMVHIARRESASGGASGQTGAAPIVSNWTPRDVDTYDEARVEVYSNCEEVELFLNGASLGAERRPVDDAPRAWAFPFDAGSLRAVGRNRGQAVAEHELRTAGKPERIILRTDRAQLTHDWEEVSHVVVTVVDEQGIPCPWADDMISFEIDGPGRIVALDNADPASHEPFQGTRRRLYQGRCLAVIAANAAKGPIVLKASAAGLSPDSVTVEHQ